jgi:hypothetical protein
VLLQLTENVAHLGVLVELGLGEQQEAPSFQAGEQRRRVATKYQAEELRLVERRRIAGPNENFSGPMSGVKAATGRA